MAKLGDLMNDPNRDTRTVLLVLALIELRGIKQELDSIERKMK